jgi:hypothetical protein
MVPKHTPNDRQTAYQGEKQGGLAHLDRVHRSSRFLARQPSFLRWPREAARLQCRAHPKRVRIGQSPCRKEQNRHA